MPEAYAFIQNLGPWEIGAIVLIVLLLFGGKKLPELARGAGKALKEFRSATQEAEKTFKSAMEESEEKEDKKDSATGEPPPKESAKPEAPTSEKSNG